MQCLKKLQPLRAVQNYFYVNVKFQRKTPRNCYTQLLLPFLGCGFEPKFQGVMCFCQQYFKGRVYLKLHPIGSS